MSKKIFNIPVEITPSIAFNMLVESLDMEWAMDEDRKFFIAKDGEWDESLVVKEIKNGHDEFVSDRGELFYTLRKLSCLIYPNLPWRRDYDQL